MIDLLFWVRPPAGSVGQTPPQSRIQQPEQCELAKVTLELIPDRLLDVGLYQQSVTFQASTSARIKRNEPPNNCTPVQNMNRK